MGGILRIQGLPRLTCGLQGLQTTPIMMYGGELVLRVARSSSVTLLCTSIPFIMPMQRVFEGVDSNDIT